MFSKNESQRSMTQKKRKGKTELQSAKECARVRFVTLRDLKHSPFSPTATVFCVFEKTVYLFRY